mgnify:CR=1 FL=1
MCCPKLFTGAKIKLITVCNKYEPNTHYNTCDNNTAHNGY